MLREELSQFLTENGVFRIRACYIVDLALCAQVYAGYIGEQGGQYTCAPISPPRTIPWSTPGACWGWTGSRRQQRA